MNQKIRAMLQEIGERGGIISIQGAAPDSVIEKFLQDVLKCPCCGGPDDVGAAWTPDEVPIDHRLGGVSPHKRKEA